MSLSILRIHSPINPSSGGTYTSIVENTRYLSSRGVITIMLTPSIHPSTPDNDITWSKTYYFPSVLGAFSYSPFLLKKAKYIANRHCIDCVIVDGLWQYCGIVASQLYRQLRIPVIQYTHGMLDPFFASQRVKHLRNKLYWYFIERFNIRARFCMIYTHPSEEEYANRWINFPVKSFIQPLGIKGSTQSKTDFTPAFSASNPCKLLFFGRIHPKKGIDILLNAISLLDDPSLITLSIIGPPGSDGYKEQLLSSIDKLNISKIVHWFDPVYGDEKWKYYLSSDLFLLPTRGENFGLTIPEALSSSLPVICTDRAAIHGFISSYQAGYVCNLSSEALARALSLFLHLSVQQRKLASKNARRLFDEVFSSSVANKQLYSLLQSAI